MRIIGAILILLFSILPLSAQAPGAAQEGAGTPPLAAGKVLQSDLIWSGDYNGIVDGNIDARTVAAIKSFQRRKRLPETGTLDPSARAALAATARTRRNAVGWRTLEDTRTGTQLGLPLRLVPRAGRSRSGSRWSANRGDVQIETFRYAARRPVFAALFERAKREPAPRRIDYSVMRGDFFVVSGIQGRYKFYTRAQTNGSEVRGYTIFYDPARDQTMQPVEVAMSSAFAAFAGRPATAADPPPRGAVEYGSAIVVDAGGVLLADRDITEQCDVITVPRLGHAVRTAVDKATGLALLRVYGARDLKPLALAGAAAKGRRVTLIGIADPQMQDGGSAVTAPKARLRGSALRPAPPLGFSGAAAIAGKGLRGMVRLDVPAVVGTVSQLRPKARLVPAAVIRKFLAAQKLTPAKGQMTVEDAKVVVVRVICVRK